MDYRALSELVMFGLLGLSILTVAVGFSIRVFLAPVLREVFERWGGGQPSQDQTLLAARVDAFEDRLTLIEDGLDRIAATQDFDRQLERPKE